MVMAEVLVNMLFFRNDRLFYANTAYTILCLTIIQVSPLRFQD